MLNHVVRLPRMLVLLFTGRVPRHPAMMDGGACAVAGCQAVEKVIGRRRREKLSAFPAVA
jgi:hypothetical protein